MKDQFGTVDSIIDEMKSIQCMEHKGKAKIVTPFVGLQLKVYDYFDLEVPKGCDLMTKSISSKTGRRKKHAAQD